MTEPLNLDDSAIPTYEPTLAVLFYQSRHRVSGQPTEQQGLASSLAALHEVHVRRSGAPLLGPATFLSRADSQVLADLFAGANRATSPPSLYPEGLLLHDETSATWFVPALRRTFALRDARGRLLKFSAVWPSLVLHAAGDTLHLAATEGVARPTLDTPLFHAPLWNVWASTQLCLGDATIPRGEPTETVAAWNAVVFDTAFSHVNHHETLAQRKTTTSELLAFWRRRSRANTPPPARLLRPLRLSLGRWLTQLQGDTP